MSYPNNSNFLAWWNMGARVHQADDDRLSPLGGDYDPTTYSPLQTLSTNVNVGNPTYDYSPVESGATGSAASLPSTPGTTRFQSGPTLFESSPPDEEET